MAFLDSVMRGKHWQNCTALARQTSSANALDMGCEGTRDLDTTVSDMLMLSKADFPDAATSARALHG